MKMESCDAEESAPSSTLYPRSPQFNHNTTTASTTDEEKQGIIDTAHKKRSSCTARYATIVVKHPLLLFGLTLFVVLLCGSVSFIPQLGAPQLPDFSEPVTGVEARGTVISRRLHSQINLVEEERSGGITREPSACRSNRTYPAKQQTVEEKATCSDQLTFFQGKLTLKLAFATANGQNLMTAENLKSICRLEQKIVRSLDNFDKHCHKANTTQNCCPSWSIGNYIAALNKKPSCLQISEDDVKRTSDLLSNCSQYYHDGSLTADCWDFEKNKKANGKCQRVPQACTRYNALHNILHYLADKEFLAPSSGPDPFLQHSLVLVPTYPDKTFQVNVYKSHLVRDDITDGNVVLIGFDLSELKFAIFNEILLVDLYLAAIAMFFIVTILWFYTRSMLLTSLVGLIVISALIIAYFIYHIVLDMKFFPFLNTLTLVFLVGIAADNAFVYMDVWNQATLDHKEQTTNFIQNDQKPERKLMTLTADNIKRASTKDKELEHGLITATADAMKHATSNDKKLEHDLISITADTIKHAGLSMFVTSFTTASAFFASLTSEITTIRLFGLYSGISILCMLALFVTWFPAAVIIDQTVLSRRTCCCSCITKLKNICFKNKDAQKAIVDKLVKLHKIFFSKFLPRMIIKLRFFWVMCFLGLAVAGIVVATAKPGLQLPTSQELQLFDESHILEKYPLKLKLNFHFETAKRFSFPINLIWGVKPRDNGNQFDPYDTGSLVWDDNFDLSTSEGQRWMLKMIASLRNQPFLAEDQKLPNGQCFLEYFFSKMNRNCTDNNRLCCKQSKFPYSHSLLSQCLLEIQCQRMHDQQYSSQSITDEAPLFDRDDNLRAIFLKFESNVPHTWSYDPVDKFWEDTEGWASKQFTSAPSSVNGWFISDLSFYDLQKSLSKGTLYSMGISVVIAFSVMLLITGNIFISTFAILTIVGALGVTVGTLVLTGWKLNVLESITLSIAVGLSIDFALHYGVAYVLASDKTDRQLRMQFSTSRMGSAITMAAFTTFVTGATVSTSRVLAYVQLGQFLMVTMSVSWVYATFFFQALCSIFGPENDTGQLTLVKVKRAWRSLKRWRCLRRRNPDHYQVVRKRDGATIEREVRVIYIK